MAKNLISVVDDDESIRRTTTFLIESFGFQAAVFDSAEAFLSSGELKDTACLRCRRSDAGHEWIGAPKPPGFGRLYESRSFSLPHTTTKNPAGERCEPVLPHSSASHSATNNSRKPFVRP